jgi:hypothetical protein
VTFTFGILLCLLLNLLLQLSDLTFAFGSLLCCLLGLLLGVPCRVAFSD